MIVGLQVLTIIASRGNVYLLAALYAFGVIWSFSFMSLAVLVLRLHRAGRSANGGCRATFEIGAVEIPVGLALITLVAVRHRAGQPVHQAAGDDCRRQLLSLSCFRRLHGFGAKITPQSTPRRASRMLEEFRVAEQPLS